MDIKKITDFIFRAIYSFGLIAMKIIIKISNWIKKRIEHQDYSIVHFTFGIIACFIAIFTNYGTDFLSIITKIFTSIILLTLMAYTLVNILYLNKTSKENYYRFMRDWYYTLSCYLGLWAIMLSRISTKFIFAINIAINFSFLAIIYYGSRYFIIKRVKRWGHYFWLFILMPILSMILWSFVSLILYDTFKLPLLINDNFFGWAVLVLTILFLNLLVLTTSEEKIPEVKVAIYLVMAIFSSVSYCFFISDYLAKSFFKINEIKQIMTYEQIKYEIESVIKWGCLPYLIGSVFGCFSIELVERNLKTKKLINTQENSDSIDLSISREL